MQKKLKLIGVIPTFFGGFRKLIWSLDIDFVDFFAKFYSNLGFNRQRLIEALFQNPVMPVIILDADFTDLRICCLKFASIGVNRILKITGK